MVGMLNNIFQQKSKCRQPLNGLASQNHVGQQDSDSDLLVDNQPWGIEQSAKTPFSCLHLSSLPIRHREVGFAVLSRVLPYMGLPMTILGPLATSSPWQCRLSVPLIGFSWSATQVNHKQAEMQTKKQKRHQQNLTFARKNGTCLYFIEGCSGVLEQMKERDLNPNLSWDQVHQTTPSSQMVGDKQMNTIEIYQTYKFKFKYKRKHKFKCKHKWILISA